MRFLFGDSREADIEAYRLEVLGPETPSPPVPPHPDAIVKSNMSLYEALVRAKAHEADRVAFLVEDEVENCVAYLWHRTPIGDPRWEILRMLQDAKEGIYEGISDREEQTSDLLV